MVDMGIHCKSLFVHVELSVLRPQHFVVQTLTACHLGKMVSELYINLQSDMKDPKLIDQIAYCPSHAHNCEEHFASPQLECPPKRQVMIDDTSESCFLRHKRNGISRVTVDHCWPNQIL